MLLVMVDRGHRELPIQPDFVVDTCRLAAAKRSSCGFRMSMVRRVYLRQVQ